MKLSPVVASELGFLLTCLACSATLPREAELGASDWCLDPGAWRPTVRENLEALIESHLDSGRAVVFDFDNTILCRDIGEATLQVLSEDDSFRVRQDVRLSSPPLQAGGAGLQPEGGESLVAYYNGLLGAMNHQPGETEPYAHAYAWLVQAMAGLDPANVVRQTEVAYADGIGWQDAKRDELGETRVTEFPRPFFYPEMVDLIGVLLKSGMEVYVVSASNIWSVRWMVCKVLNPRIQELHGEDLAIPPEHVIGISTLLLDTRSGRLERDHLLVRSNPAYAQLDPEELHHYQLTSTIDFPVSSYHGKVARILRDVSRQRPLMVVGDSPNDFAMLGWGEHRLWIARLEKASYQQQFLDFLEHTPEGQTLIQPALNSKAPGFVASSSDLERRLESYPEQLSRAASSAALLRRVGVFE